MKKNSPYSIHHIQLDAPDALDIEIESGKKYLVFWWQSVPLGHMFLEQNKEFSRVERKVKMMDAIKSALEYYTLKNEYTDNYSQAFLDNDYPVFSAAMTTLLSGLNPEKTPHKAPISVVICTRNRGNYLKCCIESLLKQVCIPSEIIVVDNAPVDDSTEKITRQFGVVTYHKEMRPGLDIARNTGARLAGFPLIAYVDDDVELHPLWVCRVWETFRENDIDAMTGLVFASSLVTESEQIFEKNWGFNKGYVARLFDQDFLKSSSPRVWEIGAGANMAFRKSVLEKVNYFDERLDVGAAGCNGDSEIWFRILLSGSSIRYNPLAVSYHKHRRELNELQMQLFDYMRGHVAAALIQHDQNQNKGYKKYVYFRLMQYYLMLTARGFPGYSGRYATLWNEIRGIISGIRFYYKNRKAPNTLNNH